MSTDPTKNEFKFEGTPEYPALDREKVVDVFDKVKVTLTEELESLDKNRPEPLAPLLDQLAHGYKVANVVGGLGVLAELSKEIFEV